MQIAKKTPDFSSPEAPPILLAVGSAIWKVVAALSNIDFVMSVRGEKFGVLLQVLLDYGWLILIVIGVLWWYQVWRSPRETGPHHVGWGHVGVGATLAFLLGTLITLSATGSVPTIIGAWSASFDGCQAGLDTSRLGSFRNGYDILLMCGIIDATTDRFQDPRIAISSPFSIPPDGVAISARYKPEDAERIKALGPSQTWFETALIPKGADMSRVKMMADVRREGGRIIRQGYF